MRHVGSTLIIALCCCLLQACGTHLRVTPEVQAEAVSKPQPACYRRVWTVDDELACLGAVASAEAPEAPLMCLDGKTTVVLGNGSTCDIKFLYRASTGKQYVVAGAGCVLAGEGESQWDRGSGPQASNRDGSRIGEVSYAILHGSQNLAVIRLDSSTGVETPRCPDGVSPAPV